MLRRLGIRAKVLAVLAVPMLVLVLLGAYISVSAFDDLEEARATQRVTETLSAYQPLGQAIDNEYVVSMTTNDKEAIAAAQAATDQALAAVRQYTEDLPLERFPAALVQQFQSVQGDYETTLPAARVAVERGGVASVVRSNFQTIERGQLELVAQLGEVFPNRDVAAAVTAYRELSQTSTDLVAELIQGSSLMGGVMSPALGSVYQQRVDDVENSRTNAAVALNRMSGIDLTLPSGHPSSLFIAQRAALITGEQESVSKVDPAAYAEQVETQTTALVELAGQAIDHATALADKDVDAALQRFYVTLLVTLAAAGISLGLALVVARSIVIPLLRLTSAASEVRERLPRIVEQVATPGEQPEVELDPIPVNSRDEVGRLAQAFNSMNATTVRVAQEQAALRGSIAEMFVNVARRDQVLLNRQLSFIDSLERTEEDPNTLANLFRLDHLATRMRRNAESLLVLAGIDSGRRLRDAMPLSDVIRTASSEIEQYDRIELDLQVDPHMLGFNALPAAHMLAELLENATVFSEPETPVTVTTGVSGQFVAVRIRDHGLGMTEEEIQAANAKILSSGAGDALGAQRLGLFVVGRIAAKLGAAVRLSKAETGTGTDTTVLLPASLFETSETNAYGAPSSVAETVAQDAAFAPEVAPVDLAALTDGETALGLPRRRKADGSEPTADSAPIPVPNIGGSGLPTRGGGSLPTRGGGELPARRKTFDEDAIVLPETAVPTLSPDLSTAAPDWAPATLQATSGSGLPSRAARSSATPPPAPAPTPAETPEAPKPEPAAGSPLPPAARAGLFSGFRTRNAVVEGGDGGAADQVRAPWMSLGAHGLQQSQDADEPEVPTLAEDDDEPWTPAAPQGEDAPASDEQDASAAEAAPAEEQPWAPQLGGDLSGTDASSDEQAWAPQQASDEQAWAPQQPADEQAADEQPATDEPAAYEAPSYQPASYEPAEEPAASYEAASDDAPSYEAAPAEAPSYESYAPAQDEPAASEAASDGPAADEPASYTPPSFEPAGYEAATEQPADEQAYQPAAYEQPAEQAYEPAASYEAPSSEAPSYEAPSYEPASYEPASAEQQTEQAYEPPSFEPAPEAATPLPTRADADDSTPIWAEQTQSEPAAEAAPEPAQAQPAAPATPEVPRVSFTSYSGYAGWSAARRRAAAETESFDFERSLDEARAWHTGALPTVAEPAGEQTAAQPAEQAPAAEAEHVEWQPTFQAPAWGDTGAMPVVEEPAAQAPVETPALEEPAPVEAPSFAAPSFEAPSFEVPSLVDDEPAPAVTHEAPAEPVAEQAEDREWAETTPAWGAPAWPSLAGDPSGEAQAPAAPTYQPAEPQPVAEQPVAQVPQPAPAPQAAPAAPAWGAPAAGTSAPTSSEGDGSSDKGSKKRWGLFGRRKAEPVPAQAAPSFTPTSDAAPAAPSWSTPAPAPVAAEPTLPERTPAWSAPEPPAPAAPAAAPAASSGSGAWSPPEWAATSRPAAAPVVDVPQPAAAPAPSAPRIGTLDDNVAAMLALRSDIQEQALSELSQLSAYRPSVNRSGERLAKRVPTAVPATAPEPTEPVAPVQRDANELRNRLSSFQSGTSRGRQAAGTGEAPRSTP